jgi:DNA-binding LytR/AlgR family response regulator
MAGTGRDDRAHGRVQVPDVMTLDDVAVGTGASIVVAVAATIAVMLAVVVAVLSHAGEARAASTWDARALGFAVTPAEASPAATRVEAPSRDTVHRVVSPAPPPRKSVALVVVGALLVAMTAATSLVWRAFARAVAGPSRGRAGARRR